MIMNHYNVPHAKTRICVVLLLMLVPLLVLLPTVRIAYAQPIVKTGGVDPGPTGAHLTAYVSPNGQDTWWVIMMHDEEGSQTWIPVGCTGERSADAGPVDVSCVVTGLTQDHGYGDMIIGCWGPDPMTCPNGAEADGDEVSWWTPLPANYATTTTTSASSIQSYTMATIMTIVSRTTSTITPTPTWPITTSQPSGPGFDFALSVSPSTVPVVQGDTAHYAVSVMYSDPSYAGTFINVQLMGLGPAMNYDLSQTGDLIISTSQTTPTGSYSISVLGSANGITHTTGMTLIVTSASAATTPVTTTPTVSPTSSSVPFDFSVTVSPYTQSVEVGGSASYVVSVIPLAGSSVPVSLTIMGLPGDVHSSFTTQSATPPYTSTLNLDFSASSANAGAYTLTVLATATGNVKSATATLMIQPKATHTSTSQTTTGGSGWSDLLQQNSLIITAALLALAVVLGVLAMRGRRQHGVAQPTGSQIFCSKCGTGNPASNKFCRGCGNKLNSSQVSEAG